MPGPIEVIEETQDAPKSPELQMTPANPVVGMMYNPPQQHPTEPHTTIPGHCILLFASGHSYPVQDPQGLQTFLEFKKANNQGRRIVMPNGQNLPPDIAKRMGLG